MKLIACSSFWVIREALLLRKALRKKAAAEIKFREVAEAYDKVCEYLRQKS